MALRWYSVVINCRDVAAQARWWGEALGWSVVYEAPDEVVIAPADWDFAAVDDLSRWLALGPALVFVPVPEGKTVKNRLHIDLAPHLTQDRDAEIARLIELGATRVEVGQGPEVTWTVLADPEGNELCVLSSRDE
jgi:catechol 2,3-dioxygenase-like lactoylglutathione lyase family enzyme